MRRLNFAIFGFLQSLVWWVVSGQLPLDQDYEESFSYEYIRSHSLSQPYWGHGWMIPNWDFFGTTVVTSDYVRLTSDGKSQQGGLWNTLPVELVKWEVVIQFKIHGKGSDLAGDGLAFWYTKERMQMGPVFGSKDYFSGLGVMIDTYSNLPAASNVDHRNDFPYISIMINNGSIQYIKDNDGMLTEVGGCEVKVRNMDHPALIKIRYDTETLSVWTDFSADNSWSTCAEIPKVVLPTKYYFGLTAETGDLTDNHDIISIMTKELLDPPGSPVVDVNEKAKLVPSVDLAALPLEENEPKVKENVQSGSWVKSFFKFFLYMTVMGVIGFTGYLGYQHYQQHNKKRFY